MNIASLFNLAGPDLFVILIIVLLLFGAKKLPELARGMGQAVREFTKAKDEFEREVTRPPTPPATPEPPAKLDQPTQSVAHDEHGDHPQETSHPPETHVV
jgi:sec-independent protein translocase protein TatA